MYERRSIPTLLHPPYRDYAARQPAACATATIYFPTPFKRTGCKSFCSAMVATRCESRDTTGNKVEISAGTLKYFVHGGYNYRGTASDNTVRISGVISIRQCTAVATETATRSATMSSFPAAPLMATYTADTDTTLPARSPATASFWPARPRSTPPRLSPAATMRQTSATTCWKCARRG